VKRALRTKSVGTKVSEAELRVLESRAAAAGLTLSEWVRDVLLGSSVDAGTMAAERAILAEMLAMRSILLNFLLKLSMRQPITEQISRELITWADENKMKRALEILAKSSAREARTQSAQPEPALPKAATKAAPGEEL
jgi:mobilization protein NikA